GSRERRPLRRRLLRDLHRLGGRALGVDRGPLASGGGGARRRRRARRAAGRRAADADALRDAAHHRAREGAGMTLDAQARRDFPILERIVNGRPLVYLDSAASSQKPRTVIEAMARYYETSHANVHRSIHTLGEEATELYEIARDRVQRFIGAAAREEIVFTRGTTDAISIVAEAVGRTLKPGDEILVTDMEHHSNLVPWQVAARDRGARIRSVPLVGGALLEALEPARGGSEMIKEVWVDRATWNDLPWRFEPGTPPIAETVGLTAAIEYLEKLGMELVREHEQALAVQTVDLLSAIPGVR